MSATVRLKFSPKSPERFLLREIEIRINLPYIESRLKLKYFYQLFYRSYRKHGLYPLPTYILWDCTRRCNLSCLHCGAAKEKYPVELTQAQIESFIDQIAPLKINFFAVTGGEPLLRQDMIHILSYAAARGMNTGIATNGFLLDEAVARRLYRAGVSSVQISLDGMEKVHNHIRQNDQSYQRALAAVVACQQAGIQMVTVATVVSPYNFDTLPELLDILIVHQVKHWKVIITMPIGRAEADACHLEQTQLVSLFRYLESIKDKIHLILGENLPYLGKYDRRVRTECTFCPVGFSTCCIGVDGNVRGCPEMPDTKEFYEGSILETPFTTLWQKGFGKYRSRQIISSDPDCRQCSLQSACQGGCWVMRLNQSHCIKKILPDL